MPSRAARGSPRCSCARYCDEYSNWRAAESLDDYLARNGIPGVCELDTRALTRHLRQHGTLRGVLRAYPANETPDLEALVAEARAVRTVSDLDVVGEVWRRTSIAHGRIASAASWTARRVCC